MDGTSRTFVGIACHNTRWIVLFLTRTAASRETTQMDSASFFDTCRRGNCLVGSKPPVVNSIRVVGALVSAGHTVRVVILQVRDLPKLGILPRRIAWTHALCRFDSMPSAAGRNWCGKTAELRELVTDAGS